MSPPTESRLLPALPLEHIYSNLSKSDIQCFRQTNRHYNQLTMSVLRNSIIYELEQIRTQIPGCTHTFTATATSLNALFTAYQELKAALIDTHLIPLKEKEWRVLYQTMYDCNALLQPFWLMVLIASYHRTLIKFGGIKGPEEIILLKPMLGLGAIGRVYRIIEECDEQTLKQTAYKIIFKELLNIDSIPEAIKLLESGRIKNTVTHRFRDHCTTTLFVHFLQTGKIEEAQALSPRISVTEQDLCYYKRSNDCLEDKQWEEAFNILGYFSDDSYLTQHYEDMCAIFLKENEITLALKAAKKALRAETAFPFSSLATALYEEAPLSKRERYVKAFQLWHEIACPDQKSLAGKCISHALKMELEAAESFSWMFELSAIPEYSRDAHLAIAGISDKGTRERCASYLHRKHLQAGNHRLAGDYASLVEGGT